MPSIPNTNEDSPTGIYISAALGALFLGVGDLLNNQNAATVLKLSETIRVNLYPNLESGGLVALILLVIFGAGVCWVQQPLTRVDAFARGFSVFALMAVTAPYRPATEGITHPINLPHIQGSISGLLGISIALAEIDVQTNSVDIVIQPPKSNTLPADTQVTLRELDTGRIVGASHAGSGKLTINQPIGRYLMEVEARGYRRTSTELQIAKENKAINIPIENSIIPLSVQRLYAPERLNETK
jgi:hypothetical protein